MTDRTAGICVDCGKNLVPKGSYSPVRCRSCNGAFERVRALAETAESDAELIAMVAKDHLSANRLAIRLGGIGRQAAYLRLKEARRREAARKGA